MRLLRKVLEIMKIQVNTLPSTKIRSLIIITSSQSCWRKKLVAKTLGGTENLIWWSKKYWSRSKSKDTHKTPQSAQRRKGLRQSLMVPQKPMKRIWQALWETILQSEDKRPIILPLKSKRRMYPQLKGKRQMKVSLKASKMMNQDKFQVEKWQSSGLPFSFLKMNFRKSYLTN